MPIPTLSLDWNCAISVENHEETAWAVGALVQAHRDGQVEVAVLAVSASENVGGRAFPPSATLFHERLAGLGWEDLPVVPAPAIYDLTFYGRETQALADPGAYERLIAQLWHLLAGEVPQDPKDCLDPDEDLRALCHTPRLHKWRNRWCDVHRAWSHIQSRRDLLVTTNTKDFQRNAMALRELGLEQAVTPQEAVTLLGLRGG